MKRIMACIIASMMISGLCACSGQSADEASAEAAEYLTKEDITVNETITNDADGEHAIEVSGEEAEYSGIGVTKTGDAD